MTPTGTALLIAAAFAGIGAWIFLRVRRRWIDSVAGELGEQYDAVEELKRSHAVLRTMLDSTADGILVTDGKGRVLDMNRRFIEMWRIPLEMNESDDEAKYLEHQGAHVADPDHFLERVHALYASDEVAEDESLELNDGRVFERQTRPMTSDGEALGRVWSFRDVTERRRHEREQAELQQEITRNESRLAMGALVSGLAHEVRNPLFTISASLDAFEARFGASEDNARYLDVLRGGVARISRLMEQLSEYGKPSQPALSATSIRDIVADAIESLPAEIIGSVRVENRVDPGIEPGMLDRPRMSQAFRCLIENAVQHSPKDGLVTIECRETQPGDDRWLEVYIQDSGPGFQNEDLPRVFEPFWSGTSQGTGLGLAIVQRIVEKQGGTVTAGNRPEGGGRVAVMLPKRPGGGTPDSNRSGTAHGVEQSTAG